MKISRVGMIKYKTSRSRISKIIIDNIHNLIDVKLLSSDENQLKLNLLLVKKHDVSLIINFQKDNDFTKISFDTDTKDMDINFPFMQGHINDIISIINSNIDENEKTESSEKTMVKIKGKNRKTKLYLTYGFVGIIVLFMISMVSQWGFEGRTYCDSFTNRGDKTCFYLDDDKYIISYSFDGYDFRELSRGTYTYKKMG